MKREDLINLFIKEQNSFHPVIPFDPVKDKLLPIDFSANNTQLTEEIFTDTGKLTSYINTRLTDADAKYGIGGYGEHRNVYSRSELFGAQKTEVGAEPRRLHLGIDIWGKPHTKVMSPLHGVIHSFAFNNNFGDYGTTVILAHYFQGARFFTLYGHLGLSSIKNMQEGDRVRQGDVFAEFGIPAENGHWPPHLHFQVVIDIGDWKGDYPGVCKYSEKEDYLENSPDPDLILQLNKYLGK